MINAMRQHLNDVDESYGQHFRMAAGFGGRMVVTGIACILHGFLPSLFTKTGSNMVNRLHKEMNARGPASQDEDWVI